MKFKNIICIILCVACLLCTVSCAQNNNVSQVELSDTLAMLYGFKKIEGVNYYCVKNTPKSDSIYAISGVVTDSPDVTDLKFIITCENDDIIINDMLVTVPYKYTKWHKKVKLNALHEPTGANIDFTIKLEDEWELVFEDDFNGTELNTDVWGDIWDTSLTAEQRDPFFFGYKKEMAFLDGKGNLVNRVYATGEFAEDGRPLYKSSAITTKDCYELTYGYYEIRMKPHLANSIKGAFWLMAGDMGDHDAINDNSSQNGCEVDVIETMSNLNLSGHALHWDGYYNGQTKSEVYGEISTPEIFDGNYHTFAVSWTPEEFVFTIDGKATIRSSAAGGCQVPAYMLISSHVGTWGGDITLKPGEYSDMLVDYVRVYQSPNNKK